MGAPRLSAVIPVYNAENTIERCLDSIFHPFINEIEVICVDDGSTDRSGEILDRYASDFDGGGTAFGLSIPKMAVYVRQETGE